MHKSVQILGRSTVIRQTAALMLQVQRVITCQTITTERHMCQDFLVMIVKKNYWHSPKLL